MDLENLIKAKTIEKDPMQISDEEFFGVWNHKTCTWEQESYFDYNKYPELFSVKEAVQKQDIKKAKEELLAYYRRLQSKRVSLNVPKPPRKAYMLAEGLEKNVYAVNEKNGATQGFFSVDNNWQEHRVDVLDSFAKEIVGVEKFRGFIIMSVDKVPSEAEICAKESDNPPVLELVVNGKHINCTAAKDAMVRGGQYGSTNYGHERIMKVQESGTYMNFNEDTKRAYIAFDISFLKADDVVSSAMLILTGRNATGTGQKELMVYRLNNMNFDEDSIVFDDYTDCMLWSCNDADSWDYITSNRPNIKGKACFYHRGNELLKVANLYCYTGLEQYAFTFIRNHMAMVHNVGFNLEVFNALDLGTQINHGSESVFKVLNSKHMTGELFVAMLKTFWLQADWLVNQYYGTASNNWGTYATMGVYAILARFREWKVFDVWYEKTRKENTRLISKFAFEDGMCLELSLAYVETVLSTLKGPLYLEKCTGVAAPFEEFVREQTYKIVKNYIYGSSPIGGGYNIGDTFDCIPDYSLELVREWYHNVFTEDEELAYVATCGDKGRLPENATTHYPVGLRTYMRSSWEKDALALAITAKGNGSHGHQDMLSIAMYAYGQFLLTDQGYGGLLTGDIREYMISAPQHNLVTIDGRNYDHIKQDGVEKSFVSEAEYDFVEYAGEFYEGILQQRSVLFLKNEKIWIVTDYVSPRDKDKVYSAQQNWHMMPAAKLKIQEHTNIISSHFEGVNVMIVPASPKELKAYTENTIFSPTPGSLIDSKKAVLCKEGTGNMVFTTLIIPKKPGEEYYVEIEILDVGMADSANAVRFTITDALKGQVGSYYYYHLNEPDQNQNVTLGEFHSDASTVLLKLDESNQCSFVVKINNK